MRKIIAILTIILLSANTLLSQTTWDGTTASDYGGGNGSSEYPYLIYTAEQLARFATDVNSGASWSEGKYFKLMADIKLNDKVLTAANTLITGVTLKKWGIIGKYNTDTDYLPFKGIFDGNGHVISGVYIDDVSMNYAGLFRYIESGTIKNLGIIDSYINGGANVGAIAGIIKNSSVVNCYNTGRVDGSGSYHGGIAGHSILKSVIANCYNLGLINGKNNCAGILGRHGVSGDGALINNCYNFGLITTTKSNKSGIVAENNVTCVVKNCYFLSTSTATGVYAGTGTTKSVVAKIKSDFASNSLLQSLNDTALIVSLASQWKLNDSIPVFSYLSFTEDLSGKPDMSKIANTPIPVNGELHADADTGTVQLKWHPATNGRTVRQYLYFSTDSVALAANTDTLTCKTILSANDTTFTVPDIYSMQKYYWRVDQKDNTGIINKGIAWTFYPRHLAFRGAEGYGRFATGGRGGKVVHVTNLNDSGDGSFRNAVTGNNGEPRTVVFDVSGIIRLNSRLIMGTNITVAGQTAPGKGICFRAAPIGVSSECICRFTRLRLGGGTTYDGMGMAGVNNAILDHASISWTIDESFSSRYAKNITLQRTLIAEALNVAGHQNYPVGTAHGYAGSISGECGSFHHNLLAHNEGRNWSLAGGLNGNGYYAGKLDIFNMVVYNWGGRATDGGVNQGNFVNNYYKKGPASTQFNMLKADLEGAGKGSQSYYVAGNVEENTNGTLMCDGTDKTCGRTYTVSNGQIVDWTVFVDKPFFPSYATIHTAKDAYKSVLSDVGCNMPVFDNHDKRVVNETLTGTYTYVGSYTGKKGLIDNEADAGGYEDYGSETRPAGFDTDGDGLPDWWENLYGTNNHSASSDFSDANADPDKDGYTSMEDYLEWMATPHYYISNNTITATIDLAAMSVGYTGAKVYSLASNSTGLNVNMTNGIAVVSTGTASPGIHYLNFKIKDTENSECIRPVGICVGTSEPTALTAVAGNETVVSVYPAVFSTALNISIQNHACTYITVNLKDITGKILLQNKYLLQQGENNLKFNCAESLAQQPCILEISDSKTGEIIACKKVIKN